MLRFSIPIRYQIGDSVLIITLFRWLCSHFNVAKPYPVAFRFSNQSKKSCSTGALSNVMPWASIKSNQVLLYLSRVDFCIILCVCKKSHNKNNSYRNHKKTHSNLPKYRRVNDQRRIHVVSTRLHLSTGICLSTQSFFLSISSDRDRLRLPDASGARAEPCSPPSPRRQRRRPGRVGPHATTNGRKLRPSNPRPLLLNSDKTLLFQCGWDVIC